VSLARGKFGIEYNPRQMEREPSGLGWVVAAIALVALVSLAWTFVKRVRAQREDAAAQIAEERRAPAAQETSPAPPVLAPSNVVPPEVKSTYRQRPAKVRNLLMRLEEAERSQDSEMAVTTIEAIRDLPGSPAADIDDALARRLGLLNVRRLFEGKNAQWVKQVAVRRGDSASRIAVENGSTLASLVRLNGGTCDRIVVGSKLYVMDHPRFNLVVHRRTRTADLSLNGKFFKRYDLPEAVAAREGAYVLPEKKRAFFAKGGIRFRPADLSELETLLPPGAPVLVSEM